MFKEAESNYLQDHWVKKGNIIACKWCNKEINMGGLHGLFLKSKMTDEEWKKRFCHCLYERCLKCGKKLNSINFKEYCEEHKIFWKEKIKK